MSPYQQRRRRFDTISFVDNQEGNDLSAPGGYTITHVFQKQADGGGGDNYDQYTHVVAVEDWTEVAPAIEFLMTFPESAGYTVSMDVRSRNAQEPEPEPVNPWKRYSAGARVFVTARDEQEAALLILRQEATLDTLDLGAHNLCVYLDGGVPALETTDAIPPAIAGDGPCDCHGYPRFDCPNERAS